MNSSENSIDDDEFTPDAQKIKKANFNKTMSLRNKQIKR